VLVLLAPGRITEPGGELRVLGLGEVFEGLLLNVGVPGGEPFVFAPGLGELPALFCEARRGLAAGLPVRVLLDSKVPHVPRVRAVQEHLLLLLRCRVHAEPRHGPILGQKWDHEACKPETP
jgi:hypothetical protein